MKLIYYFYPFFGTPPVSLLPYYSFLFCALCLILFEGFDKKAKSFFFIVLFTESVNQPSEPTMAMFQHGSLVDFQGRGHFARGQSVIERAEVLDSCQVVAT